MGRQVASPIVVAVLAALLGYTWAQGPGLRGADDAKPPNFPVAVVDMGKVFNGFKQLSERKEELQRQNQKVEEQIKTRVEELTQLQEEAKGHKEGSPEHKRIVKEFQTKNRDFEIFRREQQRIVLEAQTKMLLWAYEKVAEQVQQYADDRGIKLVLTYNEIPREGKNPQEIINGLNRAVVYQNALDITEEILQAMN